MLFILQNYLKGSDLEIADHHFDGITMMAELLHKWNKRINLTSRTETTKTIIDSVVDSLYFAAELRSSKSLIDVGTGGGFPGLVTGIVSPQCSVHCLESKSKKCVFLEECKRRLELKNVEIIQRRVEDLIERRFGQSVSRATFEPQEWYQIARRITQKGGTIWFMLSQYQEKSKFFQRSDRISRKLYRLPSGKTNAIIGIKNVG